MAIYTPGFRPRRGNKALGSKRNIVAVLQLTAMVDMFTVLVVFLLQNYASTNQILPMAEKIVLPEATAVKELTPSLVVELSKEQLTFNELPVARFSDVVRSPKVEPIAALFDPVKKRIEELEVEAKKKKKSGFLFAQKKQKEASVQEENEEEEIAQHYRMTLQVDKDINFVLVKKVLYTLYEAGAQEINFAVIKVDPKKRYENIL